MLLPRNVRRHPSGRFRAVVTIRGKRHVGPLRDDPQVAATDVELLREELGTPGAATTMRGAEKLLFADLAARGASPHTVDYYRAHLRIIRRAWGADVPIASITPEEVERYARKRKREGISESTIWAKELQVLDRMSRLLIERGEMATSPVRRARRPKLRSGRFGVLTPERVAECVSKIRKAGGRGAARNAAVVSLLFLTGIRRAELSRLRVADVDLQNRRLFVRGKTGDRYVPLGAEAREAVKELLRGKSSDRALVGGIRCIERIFERVQTAAGEPLLTPHVLRHSFATAAVRAGVQPFPLAALLGHSDPRQTACYYHLGGSEARAAVEAVSLRHLKVSEDRDGSAESDEPG